MKCKKPILLHGQYYNCGSCLACRINYTSQWQLRLLYELDCWNGASFVTLTYDNEHIPLNGSLDKKELQNFIKRVRSEFTYRQKDSLWNRSYLFNAHNKPYIPNIRYYACGEYGSERNTFRPHYHLILFGLDYYLEEDMDIVRKCWDKCDPYLFDKVLGRKCALQPVNKDCIGYVTGYVQKKLKGQKAVEAYDNRGVSRPFNVSSQGLGLVSALENRDVLSKGYTYTHNGQRLTIP